MSSRVARRIAVGLALIVVFGIAVSAIIVTPAMNAMQNPAARTAPAAHETFTDQTAANPSAAQNAAADDQTAVMAQVRLAVASAAPDSNIVIKDVNGAVALAGSVPSQNILEQARQAAQQVPGVKQVDTSALTVSNR